MISALSVLGAIVFTHAAGFVDVPAVRALPKVKHSDYKLTEAAEGAAIIVEVERREKGTNRDFTFYFSKVPSLDISMHSRFAASIGHWGSGRGSGRGRGVRRCGPSGCRTTSETASILSGVVSIELRETFASSKTGEKRIIFDEAFHLPLKFGSSQISISSSIFRFQITKTES